MQYVALHLTSNCSKLDCSKLINLGFFRDKPKIMSINEMQSNADIQEHITKGNLMPIALSTEETIQPVEEVEQVEEQEKTVVKPNKKRSPKTTVKDK